jgi:spermidine synthase
MFEKGLLAAKRILVTGGGSGSALRWGAASSNSAPN